MAEQSLHSPTNPHFFQPLLPGFETHLSVPVTFFAKHVHGSYDHIKTAKLRTDASDKTWLVKVDGLKLTDGWKDFAAAHSLLIGDIVIFRHEGDMVFHVTPFGPSCCDIQYTSAPSDNNNTVSGGTGAQSSFAFDYSVDFQDNCFLAEVTTKNLEEDKLYLPVGATSSHALNKQFEGTLLINKKGDSWKVCLHFCDAAGKYYITRGWTKFCLDNRCSIGDLFVFNVVGDGKTEPLMCACPESAQVAEILSQHPSRKSGQACV